MPDTLPRENLYREQKMNVEHHTVYAGEANHKDTKNTKKARRSGTPNLSLCSLCLGG